MSKSKTQARVLASSLLCGAALSALSVSSAQAQSAPAAGAAPPNGPTNEVSEIVVTGTRIVSSNARSVSPVQAVQAQEFQFQGRNNVVELLNSLPQTVQVGNGDFSNTSNPLNSAGGTSTVDLRGLGPTRTLVLVDGRRLGIGDPNTANTNPAPDINQIPAQLIERVEVLTGGASAVYGSDAVAGVVNFIMKRNFSGVQFDLQWGMNNHSNGNDYMKGLEAASRIPIPKKNVWDGQSRDASVAFGVNSSDGRANLTAYLNYHDQDPTRYSRRDFAACQLQYDDVTDPNSGFCAGSSSSNRYALSTSSSIAYAVVGNTFQPYSRTAVTTPPPLFNSNPYEYLQHADKRYSGGFFAHYDINKNVNLYGEFAYMKDKTTTRVAPSGLFQGDGPTENAGWLVNCNNPFLSAQQRGILTCTAGEIASGATKDLSIGRRNVEGEGRQSNYDHENYRIVGGVKGEIVGPWRYDVYAQRYYTSVNQENLNYLSKARIQQALLVTTGANGQPTCGTGCVPYNIFQEGGVTPEAVDFLNGVGTERGELTQSIASGSINGDLSTYGVKSPWALDGVGVALGGEYRKEKFVFRPDAASLSNDLAGFGGASTAVDESVSVKEAFAELQAPLVQDRPFFTDLRLEAGYRYSDYSTGVSANTWKIGGQWAPVDDIRFRTSFQRAIRAPNVIDLFLPQSVTNTSDVSADPCAGSATAPATATAAQCANTGVTPQQYGNGGSTNLIAQCPSGQCSVLNGGNPELRPERANTFSIGANLRPRFIPGLTASIDYFQIKIRDAISFVPLQVSLTNCLQTGAPEFCGNIRRAPNGILFGTSTVGGGYLSGTSVNIGAAKTRGVDFQAAYNLPLNTFGLDAYGSVNFSFTASYMIDAKQTPLPGEPSYDCAGLYGNTCDGVFPTWRHTLRTTWQSPWKVDLSVAWRHLSSVTLETNTDDVTLGNGVTDVVEGKLGARDYIDLTAVWKVRENLQLRAGVNNVFDKDPPLVQSLISGTGSPNSYPAYDLIGRRLFVALTANF